MAFIAVYDANVLYPSTLRDLLIRIAHAGLVQAKWTDEILDEVFGNLTANRPDLDPGALTRTRELMVQAVRDCLVTGYKPLIKAIALPDPDDRHVLAAAIKARAQVIVTNNLSDFPDGALHSWNIEAKAPDDFVLDQIDLDRQAVYGAVQHCATRRQPPCGVVSEEERMPSYSRWVEVRDRRPAPAEQIRAGIAQDLALGQLIYDLRTEAGLSQRELADRMDTTQSVISRLEEGGGARNRIDTLARVATALDRHLVVSFPEDVPTELKDAVQVA